MNELAASEDFIVSSIQGWYLHLQTVRKIGVSAVVFAMGFALAGCLFNAAAFLTDFFSWLLVVIVISGTSFSIRAHKSSPVVIWCVLFLVSSMKVYSICMRTTANYFLSSSSSKHVFLSSSVPLFPSSSTLL